MRNEQELLRHMTLKLEPTEMPTIHNGVTGDNPLNEQVGGDHYMEMAIQPIEFIQQNRLGFCEGNIIKYACRHQSKGKAEDVRKIIHYARLLLQLEYGEKE